MLRGQGLSRPWYYHTSGTANVPLHQRNRKRGSTALDLKMASATPQNKWAVAFR